MVSHRTPHSDRVRRLFDAKAEFWSEKYALDGALAGRRACFRSELDGRVPTESRVLDLGCGTGDIARLLASLGMNVTACDISKEMLRHASGQKLSGVIEWVPLDTDWRTLPFPSATFHAVVAASVLEYVEDPANVLSECSRVLRPGGVVLCTVPNPAHPVRWMEWALKLITRITGITAIADRLNPRLGSYLVYLQISQHRHPARWWSAAAAECGLLSVPRRTRASAHSPLRMLIHHRPDNATEPTEPCPSPNSLSRCTEARPPSSAASVPEAELPVPALPEIAQGESIRRDLPEASGPMNGIEGHGHSGHRSPGEIRSSDSPAGFPARKRASHKKKPREQALKGTVATNLALAGLGVATGIIAARLLGPEGEGELTAIQTWPLLLGTMSMLGLDSALVYFIARQPGNGRQLTTTATVFGFLSSILVGGAAWFVLPYLLSAEPAQIVSAARVFLLVGVIFALVGIPHGSLRAANSFTSWNLFRIAPGLAWLSILMASWALGHPDAIPISEWYLGSLLVCGLPFLFVVNRRLRGTFRPNFRLAPDMLRFGIPSAFASLPQTINLRFDQLLIIAFLPARSLGFYTVAVAWSGGVAPVLTAIGSTLFPHVSAETDAERRGHLLATALQGGTLVAIATSLPFMLLAPVGLPLVFGARFAPSIPSALLLVPAGAILAWAGVAEEGLRGLGRPSIVLIAEIVAAVVTVTTLPLLLHTYGIFGAAIASLLGYSTVAIFAVIAISRSTQRTAFSLVFPRWALTKSLTARAFSLLPVPHRRGVRVG